MFVRLASKLCCNANDTVLGLVSWHRDRCVPSFFQSIDHDIDVKVDIDVRYVYVSAWGFERRDRD